MVFCFLLTLSSAAAKRGHSVPTYFRGIDPGGSMVDAQDPRNRLNFTHPMRKPFTPNAVLKVKPNLVENKAPVNVSWNGIPNPSETDLIVVYRLEHFELSHYLDYFYATESPSYESGYGWHQVSVQNEDQLRVSLLSKHLHPCSDQQPARV